MRGLNLPPCNLCDYRAQNSPLPADKTPESLFMVILLRFRPRVHHCWPLPAFLKQHLKNMALFILHRIFKMIMTLWGDFPLCCKISQGLICQTFWVQLGNSCSRQNNYVTQLHILHGRGEIRLKNESTPWGRNLDTNAMKQMLLRSKYLDIHIFLPIVSQLLLWTAVWVVQQHNKASFKATAF